MAAPNEKERPSELVRVERVNHQFRNGVTALRDVSLTVARGEFLSIVGPSGCGKSTLLRLMAGLSEATHGTIDMHVEREKIGVVFQDATLLPWRTVLSNVALPMELRKVSRVMREPSALEALDLVGLGKHSNLLPRQLSGGMRMRVSIARALAVGPELLLMDEPFGALDEITRQTMQSELLRIWTEEGCTVVFVTHNVGEAVYLSNRIVVMTPTPGRIADIIDIPLDYPRNNKLRTSAQFTQLVEKVASTLYKHMANPEAS